MSRRDVVLLAVVVNAAVLALLFVLANTSDTISVSIPPFSYEPVEEVHMVKNQTVPSALQEEEVVIAVEKNSSSGVDEVIQDFVASMQSEPTVASKPRIKLPKEEFDPFASVPMVEVRVESGDVLGKIALRYQTTVASIKKANHLQSDTLRVGQILRVPLGTKSEDTAVAFSSSSVDPLSEEHYVIESGDNPWKIAKKFHVSVFELLRLNGLDESKAKNLRPGDKIRVR